MMIWKKPNDKKYTDLCIWIDANLDKLKEPGKYPMEENTIYNYLWLVVKALAIKKGMFQSFQDYDDYSFYAANRLFFAIRKNLVNQGKTIKGKLIKPIKSSLNYMKALLYPMKVEYQRQAYRNIIDEEFASKKFDATAFQDMLRENIKQSQGSTDRFYAFIFDYMRNIDKPLSKVLEATPFKVDTVDYKKIKMSILLTCINNFRTANRLWLKNASGVILWNLPKSMSLYVSSLINNFCKLIADDIMNNKKNYYMDDATADLILKYKEGLEYNDED